MSGADFLASFPRGTGDTVTTTSPATSYAVRQPTKHPVYEHFRVESFAELLHGDCVICVIV
jgi:galactokinase